ncbi:receptor-like kinase TMK2 [Rutidosis leptorrhynchoides]|uniref:receptor-like kinase TMK2 n=1 Tax=Rutidosis leptorrhynchoides TaxID=125765 RepID=UPI003A998D92
MACCVATDPNDLRILNDFRKGLDNPELLKWPENGDGDPCKWPHVFCSGDRVSQIQVQNLGLAGTLPENFNQLTKLSNVGLQKNKFRGNLPTFSGLSELEFAYLGNNNFDTIPLDFFDGLSNVRVLALDYNPFNVSTGWFLPEALANSVQLVNFSCTGCNLIGPLPGFLANLQSLTALKLSYNSLSGEIPASFGDSMLQILWLNNQLGAGGGMNGTIEVISKMYQLTQLWLHGNQFSGRIPADIGNLTALQELKLNGNQFVGLIPDALANMELKNLELDNNKLMGPIPKFKAGNVSYAYNSFCESEPGIQCSYEVNVILDFLDGMNYPLTLASQWSGNDPCVGPWLGLSCNAESKVSVINLPRHNLTGTLRPSIAKLDSLVSIRLAENNINGAVPENLTELLSLLSLDLSRNNITPPLPKFRSGVNLATEGNPLLSLTNISPSTQSHPHLEIPPFRSPILHDKPSVTTGSSLEPSASVQGPSDRRKPKMFTAVMMAGVPVLAIVVGLLLFVCLKKRKNASKPLTSIVVHPKDQSDQENMIIKVVTPKTNERVFSQTVSSWGSCHSSTTTTEESHLVDGENILISFQVIREVTNDFAPENELGRGGFGSVYRGELLDGTKIAVKRMVVAGIVNNKVLGEFEAEIGVLSKVQHRHLVSLLGFSIQGNERLLVYEYMPQGALSKHLFHWESLKLEPLSWIRRLAIALDVAKGIEYLHSLARQTFIHRDLKSSNILLDNSFRAKVSDFGLVKLAPDGERSIATRLAGTFGYLAPEYAVMGKVTTKTDVYSYGVVLMELLTGLAALDEKRTEESRYLAEWFPRITSSKEKLLGVIDPALKTTNKDETSDFESIFIVAQLAAQCTARDPTNRPDMGYLVNKISPLVVNWKPGNAESDCCNGVDYNQPLTEMLKLWQEADSQKTGDTNSGFAKSFSSADPR